jgi:hypothetical protein
MGIKTGRHQANTIQIYRCPVFCKVATKTVSHDQFSIYSSGTKRSIQHELSCGVEISVLTEKVIPIISGNFPRCGVPLVLGSRIASIRSETVLFYRHVLVPVMNGIDCMFAFRVLDLFFTCRCVVFCFPTKTGEWSLALTDFLVNTES